VAFDVFGTNAKIVSEKCGLCWSARWARHCPLNGSHSIALSMHDHTKVARFLTTSARSIPKSPSGPVMEYRPPHACTTISRSLRDSYLRTVVPWHPAHQELVWIATRVSKSFDPRGHSACNRRNAAVADNCLAPMHDYSERSARFLHQWSVGASKKWYLLDWWAKQASQAMQPGKGGAASSFFSSEGLVVVIKRYFTF